MGSRFLNLCDCADELDSVLRLSRIHQVGVRVATDAEDSVSRLLAKGFAPVVDELHCLDSCDRSVSDLPRRQRKLVTGQLTAWTELGLSVVALPAAEMGTERLIEQVYYGLLVPHLYAKGISPFGVHNEAAFRRLVARTQAVLTCDAAGNTVGAAFFDIRQLGGLTVRPDEATGNGRDCGLVAVGLVYAMEPVLRNLSRAWRHLMIRAVAEAGDCRLVSMGSDNGMIDVRYVPVLQDKLRWCASVGWLAGRCPLYVSMAREPGSVRANVFNLLVEPSEGGLSVRHHPDVEEEAAALSALLATKGCVG